MGGVGCVRSRRRAGLSTDERTLSSPAGRIGDLSAYEAAASVLVLGSATDEGITGGDLKQANDAPLAVDGITQLKFTAGTTSRGEVQPEQDNKAKLEQNGVDVTSAIMVKSRS